MFWRKQPLKESIGYRGQQLTQTFGPAPLQLQLKKIGPHELHRDLSTQLPHHKRQLVAVCLDGCAMNVFQHRKQHVLAFQQCLQGRDPILDVKTDDVVLEERVIFTRLLKQEDGLGLVGLWSEPRAHNTDRHHQQYRYANQVPSTPSRVQEQSDNFEQRPLHWSLATVLGTFHELYPNGILWESRIEFQRRYHTRRKQFVYDASSFLSNDSLIEPIAAPATGRADTRDLVTPSKPDSGRFPYGVLLLFGQRDHGRLEIDEKFLGIRHARRSSPADGNGN